MGGNGWRRGGRWAFRAVFLVSMTLAVLAYGVPLWYHLQGQRILVVTSGSMAPAPGQPKAYGQFNAGDAVSSPRSRRTSCASARWSPTGRSGTRAALTTHRIVNLVERQNFLDRHADADPRRGAARPTYSQYIQTKGDANSGPDFDLTPVANVRGTVSGVKPGWGYALGYAHAPLGRFLIFAPPLILLLLAELLSWRRRPQAIAPATPRPRESRDAVTSSA